MIDLKVEGMTCGHCVKAITQAVRQRDPKAEVQADVASGLVRVETSLPRADVVAAIEDEGYKVPSQS